MKNPLFTKQEAELIFRTLALYQKVTRSSQGKSRAFNTLFKGTSNKVKSLTRESFHEQIADPKR